MIAMDSNPTQGREHPVRNLAVPGFIHIAECPGVLERCTGGLGPDGYSIFAKLSGCAPNTLYRYLTASPAPTRRGRQISFISQRTWTWMHSTRGSSSLFWVTWS